MDISFSNLRRRKILDALDNCDSNFSRENMLLDKVVELQDSLCELQEAYAELSIKCRRLSQCAPVLF